MNLKLATALSCLISCAFCYPINPVNTTGTEEESVIGIDFDYLETWDDITYPTIKNCNSSQIKLVNKYYQDMLEVVSVSRAHLIENGVDEAFEHWFGEDGNPLTVLGALDNIAVGAKDGVLYRCDDIEGSCAEHLGSWPGYHRVNASQETVLCDYFFASRRPIEEMCLIGNITDVTPKKFAGIDLFHRFLHIESINKGFIVEYTEEWDEIVDYAANNASYAVLNTDNILYYLAETYALNLTPGGCLGDYQTSHLYYEFPCCWYPIYIT